MPLPLVAALGALSTFAFYTLVVVPFQKDAPPLPSLAIVTSASAPDAALPPLPGTDLDAGTDAGPPPPHIFRVAELAGDPSLEVVKATVGHRAMSIALAASGLKPSEAQKIIKAFAPVRSLGVSQPKDTFSFAKTKKGGHVVAFEYQSSLLDVWQARDVDSADGGATPSGQLEATKLDLVLEKKRVAAAFVVGDDLRASIAKAGLDTSTDKAGGSIVTMLDDALDGHVELSEIRPGARIRLLATEERLDGNFVRYAEVDAVEYWAATAHAQAVRTYWSPQARGHFDAKGRQPSHGGWRMPIPLARISSRFNPHRMHPVLHKLMPHNGVDFAAAPGTPIYSTASGEVSVVTRVGPCGNMVKITHPNGLLSAYCHMSRFASGLHVGERVEARQVIGYVGSTGRATGPHLHFAVKRGDVFIDPLSLKLDGVRLVPAANRDDFDDARKDLDAALDAVPLPAAPILPDVDAGADDDVPLESESPE